MDTTVTSPSVEYDRFQSVSMHFGRFVLTLAGPFAKNLATCPVGHIIRNKPRRVDQSSEHIATPRPSDRNGSDAMSDRGDDGNQDIVDPEVVLEILQKVEWETFKPWEYSNKATISPEESGLMQAQRFMAAQAFMFSWQTGRVPTGWRRPRRLADFEEHCTPAEIAAACAAAERDMAVRNRTATDRINDLVLNPRAAPVKPPPKLISRQEIEGLKKAYTQFSSDLFDIQSALGNAASLIAEISLRTKSLSDTA
jgi:hypothetical protein